MDENLRKLQEEQDRFQVDKERSRDLDIISREMGFEEFPYEYSNPDDDFGLKGIITSYLLQQESVVWTDLGCGMAIGLRDGKRFAKKKGFDPSRLRTYGYDALPLDYSKAQVRSLDAVNLMLIPEYNPIFEQKDILSVKFPEMPDIVTASFVLPYTRDPLKVISNALEQAKVGATVLFSAGDWSRYVSGLGERSCRLFEEIESRAGSSLEFLLDPFKSCTLVAVKKQEADFSFDLVLSSKPEFNNESGFYKHIYKDK